MPVIFKDLFGTKYLPTVFCKHFIYQHLKLFLNAIKSDLSELFSRKCSSALMPFFSALNPKQCWHESRCVELKLTTARICIRTAHMCEEQRFFIRRTDRSCSKEDFYMEQSFPAAHTKGKAQMTHPDRF